MKLAQEELDFLQQSNFIENVQDGLEQAVLAWEYIKPQKKLTHEIILKTHEILMKGRLKKIHLGKYREQPVWIGGHEAMHYRQIKSALDVLLVELNLSGTFSEESIKDHHIEFERIHPFIDGNGRMGRIIYNWQRLKNNLPIHVVKYEERFDYYKWFE